MADSSVTIDERVETVQGQAQAAPVDPHDGQVPVREVAVVVDEIILDANSDKAVQIPEGVGASTVDQEAPLVTALKQGTPEEQFAAAGKPAKADKPADKPKPS